MNKDVAIKSLKNILMKITKKKEVWIYPKIIIWIIFKTPIMTC